MFPRSRQFVGPTSCQIQHRSFCYSCSTLSHLPVWFIGLIYLYLYPLNSQILLECSDIRIELLWVLIYICSGSFIYNWDIKLMHVLLPSLKWSSTVSSLGIVQWDFTRRDHPGNPGRVSGSGPVSLVSEL